GCSRAGAARPSGHLPGVRGRGGGVVGGVGRAGGDAEGQPDQGAHGPPEGGSQGEATRASGVTTAMWPDTNPRPCGAAPRTTTSSSSSLGRPRRTKCLTTLASAYTPAPARASPAASRHRREARPPTAAAGPTRRLPSCIGPQTTPKGTLGRSLTSRKASASGAATRSACTGRAHRTSPTVPAGGQT